MVNSAIERGRTHRASKEQEMIVAVSTFPITASIEV